MAAKTFTLPTGEKIHTATQRRYVLISRWEFAAGDRTFTAIDKRSDSADKLRAMALRIDRASIEPTRLFLGDTTTGDLTEL